jgi:hypothetical protein
MSESFQVNLSFSGSVILESKIYKWLGPILNFYDYPLWRGIGPLSEQTWIPFMQDWFIPSSTEISQVVLEKNIWKDSPTQYKHL